MHKIQANTSGTRSIEVSNTHLATLQKYSLLSNLIDSNGVVDEVVLDKLKLNVRSLLESEAGKDKELLDLCLDVIYHQNMKALGLKNLVDLYKQYSKEQKSEEQPKEGQIEGSASYGFPTHFLGVQKNMTSFSSKYDVIFDQI